MEIQLLTWFFARLIRICLQSSPTSSCPNQAGFSSGSPGWKTEEAGHNLSSPAGWKYQLEIPTSALFQTMCNEWVSVMNTKCTECILQKGIVVSAFGGALSFPRSFPSDTQPFFCLYPVAQRDETTDWSSESHSDSLSKNNNNKNQHS